MPLNRAIRHLAETITEKGEAMCSPFFFWRVMVDRLISILTSSALAVGLALFGVHSARAAELALKVGIFDLKKIVNEIGSEGPVKAENKKQKPSAAELKRAREDALKGPEAEEVRKEIRRLSDELNKAKGLSQKEREKKEAEIDKVRKTLTTLAREAREEAKKGRKGPDERILAAVAKYGEEQGFLFLFEQGYWNEQDQKGALVFTGKVVDVTQEIIQYLKTTGIAAAPPKKEKGQKKDQGKKEDF